MQECERSGNSARAGLDLLNCATEQAGTSWIAIFLVAGIFAVAVIVYFKFRNNG